MSSGGSDIRSGLRFQPDEPPPTTLALGLGLQLALLNIAAVMIIPMIVMRAAGQSEDAVAWAVFASVAICGATTMLQVLRFGRIGSGHLLVMGTSAAYISICIEALAAGGPALLAVLVVVSSLVPIALSWRLSLFQRILTPTVAGTVIMLIPVTVMPVMGDMLSAAPDGRMSTGAVLSAAATVAVISGLTLKGPAKLRLWAPIIGVAAGSGVGGFFGLFNVERIAGADWINLPAVQWPGFDVGFGSEFWVLLPGFMLVAVVVSLRTISSCVAVQRISWRQSRAVDFRSIQGAMTVDGVGSFLSGLAGTVPGTTYTTSVPLIELTGVAARIVGLFTGAAFLVLVFLPKVFALVLAIPDPVFAAYFIVLLAMLFIVGLRIVLQDGLDKNKGFIVGAAFLVGFSLQYELIYPEFVSQFAGGLFRNGMTAGGLVAILLNLALSATGHRRYRMETALDTSALAEIRSFLGDFASRSGWDAAMAGRLDAVAEETLLTLTHQEEQKEQGAQEEQGARQRKSLRLVAFREESGAVLEFVVAPRGENFQDRLATLPDDADETSIDQEVSLRLLRHLASSVRHQQYHDTDIVTVRVKATATADPAG
ncbi:MAG: hypothetical protein F4Y38_02120 [Gemmatimonadetes bacterium]|nr:hypothetical protein [Gemmatimonadota bacterium]MYG84674.1 hypothetical protein [Gemmatimonadota bacterium]MYJ89492.1 hypothetical protein [Gemmatimonadota bacterium]